VFVCAAWGIAAAPPQDSVRREIVAQLEASASADGGVRQRAETRLLALAAQSTAAFREELARLRREELLMAKLLGEGPEAVPVGVFFAEKLARAERALNDGRAAEARLACEAILALGCGSAMSVRATRLARLARDREFMGETFVANLRPAAESIGVDAKPAFVLELWNRTDRPAKVTLPAGVEIQLSFRTLSEGGQPFGEELSEVVPLPKGPLMIEPGTAWEFPFTPKTESAWAQPYAIQRITAQGRLVRVGVESAGRAWDRTVRVPHAVVFRARTNLAGAVSDPLGAMRAAISAADTDTLLVASVVAAWEDKTDEAVAALLDGTAAPEPVSRASFLLLRLLTGENHGSDRAKWISYYLAYERVGSQGALTQW
jgi:hypothetical protein